MNFVIPFYHFKRCNQLYSHTNSIQQLAKLLENRKQTLSSLKIHATMGKSSLNFLDEITIIGLRIGHTKLIHNHLYFRAL